MSSLPEKIVEAARLASAHEFIMALPNGYNTVIGGDMNLEGENKKKKAAAYIPTRK